jgi:hypothetical protein
MPMISDSPKSQSLSHSTLREGVIAGALGATGVALWFLVVDIIGGRLFYTPIALGTAVSRTLGLGAPTAAVAFVGYTILHYAAFAALGIIIVAVVHRSRAEPTILAAALLVFVASEAAFYAAMLILNVAEGFGRFGWAQIAAANILGSVLVGVYLWRKHPGLKGSLDEGLGSVAEGRGGV